MSKTIRTFVGITVPEDVKELLWQTSRSLANHLPPNSVRWVKQKTMHLTLFFLGDTASEKLPILRQRLNLAGRSQQPFQLTLGAYGCFPSCRRPRVLWVGLGEGNSSCQQLKKQLNQQLQPLGWKPEQRAYVPHLTLGYARRDVQLPAIDIELDIPSITWQTNSFHLFQSDLKANGPIYTIRHTVTF